MTASTTIILAPLVSSGVLWSVGLVAAALCVFALYRRAAGSFFRALTCAVFFLALLNPSLLEEQREPLKDKALVVVDDSASMGLGERAAQRDAALESIRQKLDVLPDMDYDVLRVAGDDESNLFRALEQKRAELPADRFAGTLLITDGQIHDKPVAPLAAPLHAFIAGRQDEVDRRLRLVTAPTYGIVGQKVKLVLRVDDSPRAQSNKATINLTRDDGQTENIVATVGEDTSIDLSLTHGGANRFVLSTETLAGEVTPLNNSVLVSVNGIRDRLRVLLISGEPHSGERAWRNLLKGDPAVDLIHFTILRSPMQGGDVPNNEMALIPFPVHELFVNKLKEFDLIIFDGFGNRLLVPDAYLGNIAAYVEKGGALLVSNATSDQAKVLGASSLARILPATTKGGIISGSFVPQVTKLGARHPVTSALESALPRSSWAPWFRMADSEVKSDQADVLMTGQDGKPLLVLAHAGQGRVAQFLSNQFWLWARHFEGGGPDADLLRRTAHWLVQEPELSETALSAHAEKTAEGWRIVVTRQSLRDDKDNVVITGDDNQPVQLSLVRDMQAGAGVLSGSLPVKAAGLYRVKADDQTIIVAVGAANTLEFGDVVATDNIVAPLAKASGGKVTWLQDKPDGGDLMLRHNHQYRITGSQAVPLLPPWLALTIILAFMVATWRREGKL